MQKFTKNFVRAMQDNAIPISMLVLGGLLGATAVGMIMPKWAQYLSLAMEDGTKEFKSLPTYSALASAISAMFSGVAAMLATGVTIATIREMRLSRSQSVRPHLTPDLVIREFEASFDPSLEIINKISVDTGGDYYIGRGKGICLFKLYNSGNGAAINISIKWAIMDGIDHVSIASADEFAPIKPFILKSILGFEEPETLALKNRSESRLKTVSYKLFHESDLSVFCAPEKDIDIEVPPSIANAIIFSAFIKRTNIFSKAGMKDVNDLPKIEESSVRVGVIVNYKSTFPGEDDICEFYELRFSATVNMLNTIIPPLFESNISVSMKHIELHKDEILSTFDAARRKQNLAEASNKQAAPHVNDLDI